MGVSEMSKERFENRKEDTFYYAKYNGIPCYFQPEENELIGRNKVCDILLDIALFFNILFGNKFKLKLEHRTIARRDIKKWNSIKE